MSELSNPLHLAALGSALLWPLAAGVAIVVWSKSRAAARRREAAAVEDKLKDLYHHVETKPVPGRLRLVVDALEEADELTPSGAKASARKGTPAGS